MDFLLQSQKMSVSTNVKSPDENPALAFYPGMRLEAPFLRLFNTDMEASLMTCLLK
jgi:hypothetical protein